MFILTSTILLLCLSFSKYVLSTNTDILGMLGRILRETGKENQIHCDAILDLNAINGG